MHAQGGSLPDFSHIMCPYSLELKEDGERGKICCVPPMPWSCGSKRLARTKSRPYGRTHRGAGGLIFPPSTYWPHPGNLQEYGILLCLDEVISGFGRTGDWFVHPSLNLKPDTVSLAKGITSGYQPLSALLVSDRVAEVFEAADEEFIHGYTYSGHPVACAVALKNLELIEKEGVLDHVSDTAAPYLAKRLHETFDDHPHIGEVRCWGMLAALELVKDKATGERFPGDFGTVTRDQCFQRISLCGCAIPRSSACRTITAEIDEIVTRAKAAIDAAVEIGLGRK